MARALEIGAAEGLEAVSLRRLAADLGVTPMALYRHFKDKQDLVNAMAETVLEDLDLTVGIEPGAPWSDRIRRAMRNFKEQMDAKPLALPLAIAYSGEGWPGMWKMNEDLLGIMRDLGVAPRQAVVLLRIASNLLSGYVLLMHQGGPRLDDLDEHQQELFRRRSELALLSLPKERYPNSIASARDVAEVWLADPDLYWQDTMDLLVAGLERLVESKR